MERDMPRDGGPADLSPVQPSNEPDWGRVAVFLDSLWNQNRGLLRRVPGGANYYTASDNVLAARAYEYLLVPNLARRDAILSVLRSFRICGCADTAGHDATINHRIDPVVTKMAQVPLTPRIACTRAPESTNGPAGSCGDLSNSCPPSDTLHDDYAGWLGDACNVFICNTNQLSGWDTDGRGKGAADLIALQLLNRRNRGMGVDALWQVLLNKWDGKGLNDQATTDDGRYATRKLALFKIAARVLGKTLPAGVDDKLKESQGMASGGMRTNYALDGSFSLDQKGDLETTALTVLAYRKPVSDF
jgi:hypothetical protein